MPRKKLRKKTELLILGLLAVLSLFLLANLISNLIILDEKKIYTSVIISDHAGFDLNKTALTFGMTQAGGGASRSLIVKNNFKDRAKVMISAEGSISDFLSVSENHFILDAGEEKIIDFSVITPKGISEGKYEGVITITLKRKL